MEGGKKRKISNREAGVKGLCILVMWESGIVIYLKHRRNSTKNMREIKTTTTLICDCQGGSLGELAGKSMGINSGGKKLTLTM